MRPAVPPRVSSLLIPARPPTDRHPHDDPFPTT